MKNVYLDFNATTPLDLRVFEKMKPSFSEDFGNPVSEQHAWGWSAKKAVENGREQVAQLINASTNEIIFTAGSSGSNFIAILGTYLDRFFKNPNLKPHFITSNVEHSSVSENFKFIEKLGGLVTYLPVNKSGLIEIEQVINAIRPETVLVSLIWVNNEVGSINPIPQIGAVLENLSQDRAQPIYFHSDGTQAIGKIEVDIPSSGVHLLSMSAHKVYGPKGIGGLYVRKKNPEVCLETLISGGAQEKFRSGTQNVPGIVGFGEACTLAKAEGHQRSLHVRKIWEKLYMGLKEIFPDLQLNGDPIQRSFYNLNVTFPTLSLDLALPHLSGLGYSRGSACLSGNLHKSKVLTAIGLSEQMMGRSVRLSFGPSTTEAEINSCIEIFKGVKQFSNPQSHAMIKGQLDRH